MSELRALNENCNVLQGHAARSQRLSWSTDIQTRTLYQRWQNRSLSQRSYHNRIRFRTKFVFSFPFFPRLYWHKSLFHRICPGRYLAKGSLFMSIVSILHTFNIYPVVDESGQKFDPFSSVVTGMVSWVFVVFLPWSRLYSPWNRSPEYVPCTIKPRSEKAKDLIEHFCNPASNSWTLIEVDDKEALVFQLLDWLTFHKNN